jgi:hypothetical protein
MKRSASTALSMRRSSSQRHMRSRWSSICSGRGGVPMHRDWVKGAGSAKGNVVGWRARESHNRKPDPGFTLNFVRAIEAHCRADQLMRKFAW